jgi:hypothetical protein
MISIRSIALATTAAAALVPAVASAKTYCVFAPDCTGISEWTIQDAVNAAAKDGDAGRIELGEGTYSGNVTVPNHPGGIAIVGAGEQKTILEPMSGNAYTVELNGGSVSNVGLSLPNIGIEGPHGIMLSEGASADHVRAALTGMYQAKPFVLDPGAHLSHVDVDAGQQAAVIISDIAGPGPATIADSSLRGGPAVLGWHTSQTAILSRDHLVAAGNQDAVLGFAGTTIVEDSVIDQRGSNGSALGAVASTPSDATVEGRRVTILGDANTTGASATSYVGAGAAKATLSDSVLVGVGKRVVRVGDGSATLAVSRVDTWPWAPDTAAGAAFTDVGSFSANPLLGTDFVPAAGSPVIDAAGAVGPDESTTDFYGKARAVDGDGSCNASPDLGAVEAPAMACAPPAAPPAPPAAQPVAQPPAPVQDTVAPRVTKIRLAHRRSVRFTLSEAARVTVRITRAHRKAIVLRRSVAAGQVALRLRHALPRGRCAIRVMAVDAAGNRAIPQQIRTQSS